MAKNTFSSAFRTLDVDRCDASNFWDEVPGLSPEVKPHFDLEEIGDLLARNQPGDALIACLDSVPLTVRSQAEKVNNN
jgi:hypothetical protein